MHSIWNSRFIDIEILKFPKKIKICMKQKFVSSIHIDNFFHCFGVRIITLVNAILLRFLLSIRQKQQGRLEVDGRYVAVNVAASAKLARMTDIFGVNNCVSFFTTKYMSV